MLDGHSADNQTEGLIWSNHSDYQSCTHDNHITGNCGVWMSVNITVCVSVDEAGVTTKELSFGPVTSTGGNDWSAIHFTDRVTDDLFAMPLALLSSRTGTFSDGSELGFPPLHNHHTIIDVGDELEEQVWIEQQADSQCPGQPDGFACHDQDLQSLGLYKPLRANTTLRFFALYNDVRHIHAHTRQRAAPPCLFRGTQLCRL